MRIITLEEHFATPAFFNGPARFVKERAEKIGDRYLLVLDRLCDLGEKRITEMDEAGIDVQVLSLSAPGVEQMEPSDAIVMARDTNDYLADAVKKHPARFAGFAAVPTSAPKQAAEELERRIKQGFKGAVINGHTKGRYLDDQFFWPLLECVEALNVPIYLHPTPPYHLRRGVRPLPQAAVDHRAYGRGAAILLQSPGRHPNVDHKAESPNQLLS
jgi:uncharacterized protein